MNYASYTTAEDLIVDIYKTHCQDCVSFFQGLSSEDVTRLMASADDMTDDLSKQAFEQSFNAAVATLDVMEELKRENHDDLYNKVVELNMATEEELKSLGELISDFMGIEAYTAMSNYAVLIQPQLCGKVMGEQYRRALAS